MRVGQLEYLSSLKNAKYKWIQEAFQTDWEPIAQTSSGGDLSDPWSVWSLNDLYVWWRGVRVCKDDKSYPACSP